MTIREIVCAPIVYVVVGLWACIVLSGLRQVQREAEI